MNQNICKKHVCNACILWHYVSEWHRAQGTHMFWTSNATKRVNSSHFSQVLFQYSDLIMCYFLLPVFIWGFSGFRTKCQQIELSAAANKRHKRLWQDVVVVSVYKMLAFTLTSTRCCVPTSTSLFYSNRKLGFVLRHVISCIHFHLYRMSSKIFLGTYLAFL